MPDVQLFSIQITDEYYADIIHFLTTGWAPVEFTKHQKKPLVVKAADFTLITGQLYKLGPNVIQEDPRRKNFEVLQSQQN